MTQAHNSQIAVLAALDQTSTPRVSQTQALWAYGPPAAKTAENSQTAVLIASTSGETNVTAHVTQTACLFAYFDGQPDTSRQSAWTFVMDGHRFYVLPLGPEGDWAYDTITQEWCQLQTQGFDGLNFTNGVMWNMRVIGGDSVDNYLYELDPEQPLDEEWREIEHVVTGGIPMRNRSTTGVANVIITASVDHDTAIDKPISLAFSDDNGATWSPEFDVPLTDESTQRLIWNSLGSFTAPGRVFRFTDYAGPVRLDGADCTLTIGNGADSGQDQDQNR